MNKVNYACVQTWHSSRHDLAIVLPAHGGRETIAGKPNWRVTFFLKKFPKTELFSWRTRCRWTLPRRSSTGSWLGLECPRTC